MKVTELNNIHVPDFFFSFLLCKSNISRKNNNQIITECLS